MANRALKVKTPEQRTKEAYIAAQATFCKEGDILECTVDFPDEWMIDPPHAGFTGKCNIELLCDHPTVVVKELTDEGLVFIGLEGITWPFFMFKHADSMKVPYEIDGNETSVNDDGSFSVGCQILPFPVVEAIYNACKEAKNNATK